MEREGCSGRTLGGAGAASAGQAREPRRLPGALGPGPGSAFLSGPGPSVGAEEADGGSAVVGSGRGQPRVAVVGRKPPAQPLGRELGWAPVAAEPGAARCSAHSPAPGFCLRLLSFFISLLPPFSFVFCLFPSSPLWLERSGKRGARSRHEVCSACIISACPGRSVIPLLTSFTQ